MLRCLLVWIFPGLPEFLGNPLGICLNLIAQLNFFLQLPDRRGDLFDLRCAISLGGFVLRTIRSFQSVPQILPLGGQLGNGFLQAFPVGLQVCDSFDLVVDQELRFGNVAVQLEHVLPQEIGRSLNALGVVLDGSQQNAIFEVQGPEAG